MSNKFHMLNARRDWWKEAALLVLCSFFATGCSGCDFGFDISFGPGWDGGYDDDYRYDGGYCDQPRAAVPSLASDRELLRSFVTCEDGIDCGLPGRDVLRGTTLQFRIPIPLELLSNEIAVESSDPGRLDVMSDFGLGCDGFEVVVAASFNELGEAAIVLRDGTREIDRFTTTTHDLARLELVGPGDDTDGGVADDVALEAITLDEPLRVELVLRSETGAALTGGAEAQWRIFDDSIASFDYDAIVSARERVIVPLRTGQTILRIRSNGQFLILGVYATAAEDDSDGGSAF